MISKLKEDQEKLCELCTKGFSTEFGEDNKDVINLGKYIDKRIIIKINKILKEINYKNIFNFKKFLIILMRM